MRAIRHWHSGSPKRTLCSSSLTSPSSIMSPAKMTPVNGHPSAAMPSTVGCTMVSITTFSSAGVSTGAGE